jgi:tRNA threonylcarbamoyladenosine biosynthesis protein TsaB
MNAPSFQRGIALEMSGRTGSIATVGPEGSVLTEAVFPHGLQHAAQAVPIADRLMREVGWAPRDLTLVCVSIGPGSFTGLRIAVTIAKSLALATGCRIVAVPTVRVLAENAPDSARHVTLVLDAKRGQIFTATFSRELVDTPWVERAPARLDTLVDAVADAPRPLHLLGEGLPYHLDTLRSRDGIEVAPESAWRARASVVARLGHAMALRGAFADPLTLTPLYVRLPEAVEKWQAASARPPA